MSSQQTDTSTSNANWGTLVILVWVVLGAVVIGFLLKNGSLNDATSDVTYSAPGAPAPEAHSSGSNIPSPAAPPQAPTVAHGAAYNARIDVEPAPGPKSHAEPAATPPPAAAPAAPPAQAGSPRGAYNTRIDIEPAPGPKSHAGPAATPPGPDNMTTPAPSPAPVPAAAPATASPM